MPLASTEGLIEALRAGRMVIVVDDEDRENEGDFLIAADAITPEHIAFMARHGRGLICLTLTAERCAALELPLMVRDTYFNHTTNFTVSIDAADLEGAGPTARGRARTIRMAIAPEARPSQFVQPGNVFPLMAQPGGVLVRAGHTEAGCDLARLAGFTPAAVIVEILNPDGSMARRPELEALAEREGLLMGSVADLIRFRLEHERTVQRIADCPLPTAHGELRLVGFRDLIQGGTHLALVKGQPRADEPTLVRVHVQNPLCDLTASLRPECGWPLQDALARISAAPSGVVVLICQQWGGDLLADQLRALAAPPSEHIEPFRNPRVNELLTIGLGGQILADLGVGRMRLLSVPRRIHALSGFGLTVEGYVTPEREHA
jgi:3,4-dihydroxy 2-butanone 4-phosphate synthase/GTP cyclohydrolase II